MPTAGTARHSLFRRGFFFIVYYLLFILYLLLFRRIGNLPNRWTDHDDFWYDARGWSLVYNAAHIFGLSPPWGQEPQKYAEIWPKFATSSQTFRSQMPTATNFQILRKTCIVGMNWGSSGEIRGTIGWGIAENRWPKWDPPFWKSFAQCTIGK